MTDKTLDEVKNLVKGLGEKYDISQDAVKELQDQFNGKVKSLNEKFEALQQADKAEEIKGLTSTIDELQNEISDIRTKSEKAFVPSEVEEKAARNIVTAAMGSLVKAKGAGNLDLLSGLEKKVGEQIKALNIGTDSSAGYAVAEVLRRDVIEYAREFSPILSLVGRNSMITRDMRMLVTVGYPSLGTGYENIAGSVLPETDTQTYAEVRSKSWKVYAKPRITDEAMSATDINVYSHLLKLLGEQMRVYQAAQVLQGTGTDTTTSTNARGILSYRVDITNLTGESFKPTIDATDARDHDIYPVKATGVSGGFGADDEAIVDYFIDLINEHPTQFLQGAKFIMNRKTKGVLEKVRDTQGRPLLVNNYMDSGEPRIRGYAIVIDDTMPNVAADSTPIIFGRLDLAYYLNDGDIDKMLLDPYSEDQCTLVKTSKEMFEMVGNTDAIKIVACTTNALA